MQLCNFATFFVTSRKWCKKIPSSTLEDGIQSKTITMKHETTWGEGTFVLQRSCRNLQAPTR